MGHGWTTGEVVGRDIQIERNDRQVIAENVRHCVDRAAARLEIRYHLLGDVCRVGRDALGRNPMVSREDDDLHLLDNGR